MAEESAPKWTGRVPFFALSRATILRMRPLVRVTVWPVAFSTALSSVTASSELTGCLLITVMRPSTGASLMMTKPAVSER
jgi:hypothetical protein